MNQEEEEGGGGGGGGGNIRKYTTFCGGINEDSERKSKKK